MRLRHSPTALVLLALLTIFVQQGAWLHSLSHVTESAQTRHQDEKSLPPDHACEECVAYAAVGAAVPSLSLPGLVQDELPPPPATPAARLLPSIAEPYRARGPPVIV